MKKSFIPLFTLTATFTTTFLLLTAMTMANAQSEKSPKADSANPQVVFKTTEGDFTLELHADKAPATVKNFLAYVESGFYEGTIFHRVIKDFVVQGGGFDEKMKQKQTLPNVRNEADNGLGNKRGTVAMARTNDPHSASSQFFINLKDNLSLDHTGKNTRGWGYCVFGRVTKGMDTVRKMESVETATVGPFQNVPKKAIVVKEVSLKK